MSVINATIEGKEWGSWTAPDLVQTLKKRRLLLKVAKGSKEIQKSLLKKCKEDVVYFVNTFCWTVDQRNLAYKKPVLIPFILWKRQEDYLRWRDECVNEIESGLIEKSRDAGITWCNVAWQVHKFLFQPGYKGAFGSRKAMLVDRLGDPDSIFEKIRIILRHLPNWIIAPSDYIDNSMKIINKKNGAQITGEAGDYIGRGGRNLVYDVDESAYLLHADTIDAALSNNAPIIFHTSTPNGIGNPYYQKRHGGVYKVFVFDWRDDPRKDQAWYDKQLKTYGKHIVAREIDRSYAGSVEGLCIPAEWVQAAIDWLDYKQYAVGDLIAGLDVADGGSAESVLTLRRSCIVYRQTTWKQLSSTQLAYTVRRAVSKYPLRTFVIDAMPSGCINTLSDIHKTSPLPYELYPFKGNATPNGSYWKGERNLAKDKFANARTEAAYVLSERFRKTFEHRKGIRTYPIEELISIPNDPVLIAQLSVLKLAYGENGKLQLESKKDLAKRQIKSPDRFDSLMYAYAPVSLKRAFAAAWGQTKVQT